MIIFDSDLAGFCVRFSGLLFYKYVESVIFLDSSMVEHAAVNRGVVGSSPTRGVKFGSMVKRLRHRPFTAVTRVRFPLESLSKYGAIAKW